MAAACHAGIARADFAETFCDNSAAAPWQAGGDGAVGWPAQTDGCSQAGQSGFYDPTNPIPASTSFAAQLVAPAGETFSAVSLSFQTEPVTNGDAFLTFGYGSVSINPEYELGDPAVDGTIDDTLPDATSFWARYDCDNSSGCELANFYNALGLGPVTVTIHDTGTPSVSATGGSLASDGTVKSAQTLLYHATDTGSGVQKVSLSLGSTVVATDPSTCQVASLTPCPATVNGTLNVNTADVPDGTYPVILTADDVSGDATPVQVSTVTVANHIGTTTVHPSHHRRAIRTRVTFKWDPRAKNTKMIWTHFGRLPHNARVTITCTGHHCPFHHLHATGRDVRHLERRLHDRTFHTGDHLTLTITAPRHTPETGTIRIRHLRLPVSVTRGDRR